MSTVIKACGPIRGIDGATFNFDDLAGRAKDYLDQVRGQAAELLQKAQQDAAAIRTRAEEEGRQAAMRAVEKVLDEKVGRQMATLLPALKQTIEGVQQAKQGWLRHWEQAAVHLATAIAGRVIRQEVSHAPQITLTLVREALEMAAGSTEIQVRLHPHDFATLGGQVQQLTAELSKAGQATVIGDSAIAQGGCRVDTRFGAIDQQFESQLARIESELTG